MAGDLGVLKGLHCAMVLSALHYVQRTACMRRFEDCAQKTRSIWSLFNPFVKGIIFLVLLLAFRNTP